MSNVKAEMFYCWMKKKKQNKTCAHFEFDASNKLQKNKNKKNQSKTEKRKKWWFSHS